MKTGIIFDLDGTLLDTLDDLHLSTNAALEHFGYPARSREELRSFVGNGALRQITLSCPEGTENVQDVLAWYKTHYGAHCQDHTAPYAGIADTLANIREKYPVAIVSNKPDAAVKTLCARHFPGVYALGETPEIQRKPSPDMIYAAMKTIGVDACIYVGDSEVDIVTAKNGNFPCVSVLWGFRDRDVLENAGGNYFCEYPQDLLKTIESV